LRHGTRPPFALDRLRELDPEHRCNERTEPCGRSRPRCQLSLGIDRLCHFDVLA
jgi:hypothetical protein